MIEPNVFKQSVNAEGFDLAKLGWTENRNDEQVFSYIRGYIWRNYKIRIKSPLDFIIKCMIDDILDKATRR